MRILTFRDFRKEFFDEGLGTYFSEPGLKAVYRIMHNPDAYPETSYHVSPQVICRWYSEVPEAESEGLGVMPYELGNGNVIIAD